MKNKKVITCLIDQETNDAELTNYYTDLCKERAVITFPELTNEISEAITIVKVVYRDQFVDQSKLDQELESFTLPALLNPDHFLTAICTQKNDSHNPDISFYFFNKLK